MSHWQLKSVTKTFGLGRQKVTALQKFSLDIHSGELLVLLGKAGAGKSTVLRVLSGLESPDMGSVYNDGIDISGLSPDRRDISMVFQNFSLYPHLNVFQNLAFPLRSKKVSHSEHEIETRVNEAAEIVGISKLMQRATTNLSGGERQRVALARCLVRKPKLFLLDEPLVNLDAKLRETMRTEIFRIQREVGAAMIYVTHDSDEGMAMADRLALIHEGRLIQVGSPFDVYNHPSTTRAALLLGNPPINLLPGKQAKFLGLVGDSTPFYGIRPESLSVQADPHGQAVVMVVEHFGNSEVLGIAAGNLTLKVLVSGSSGLTPGNSVKLTVDEKDLFRFQS